MRGRMPGPTRIVEHGPGERDQIRITGADDRLRLLIVGDQPDGDDRHSRCHLHAAGQGHLVAGPHGNPLRWRIAPARDVHSAATARFQFARKCDRLLQVPSAGRPVRALRRASSLEILGGKAARTASKTSSGKRMRPCRLPPYSSSRWFDSGERNWCSR